MAPWLASGLVYASALALTAGGITLLYITTRTFNFAHASMATWGFYIAYTGTVLYGGSPYRYFPVSFLFGSILGAICYVGLNRPLLRRRAAEITLMMSTLGYDLVLLSGIQIYCDYLTHTYRLFPRRVTMGAYDVQVFGMNASSLILPLTAILLLTAFHLFLVKTKFGISMRATIENPLLAGASGMNADRVYLAAWVIGGGMASLGGAFMSMAMTGTPVMGMMAIPFMFAGAILGGLHSLYGGILGGLILGLVEYGGVYYLAVLGGPWVLGYRMAIPLVIMAVVLLCFPSGLAGLPWGSVPRKLAGAIRGVKS